MPNQHLLILWDANSEFPNGPDLYEDLTRATIPYLMEHCGDPSITGGWLHPNGAAAHMAQMLDDFTEFLKATMAPADVQVIVCSPADGLVLAMDTKEPITFYPFHPMAIEHIESLLIRGAHLQTHDRLTKEMEDCLAILHKCDGVKSVPGINDLRQATADFFDRTRFRWGQHFTEAASPEAPGKAVA